MAESGAIEVLADIASTIEIDNILASSLLTQQDSSLEATKTPHNLAAKRRTTGYQINSKIELAELYWQCSGIGKIIKDPVTGEPAERCPYSLNPKLSPFPYFTNPFRIKGFGTSIPLFFLFITCCLVLLLIQYFGVFYLGTVFRAIYCQDLKDTKGLQCSMFDAASYKFPPTNKWFVGRSEEVKGQIINGMISVILSIYAMYVAIFLFSMMKVKMRFESKEQDPQAPISEFTVMVERVNGNHTKGVLPVLEFISEMMERQGEAEAEVVKVVLAKASGSVIRLRNHLKVYSDDLRAIKEYRERVEGEEQGSKNQMRAKIFSKLQKGQEKQIKKLRKKIERLEKNKSRFRRRNLKSIAFITFKTNRQRDAVLRAYNRAYNSCYLPRLFKDPWYKISAAMQPESISWDTIGCSTIEMILRACVIRPLLFLLVPFFIVAFFVFNLIFTALHILVKDRPLVILLNIGVFFAINIFSYLTLRVIGYLNRFELGVTKNNYIARQVFITAVLKVFYLYLGYVFLTLDKLIDDKNKNITPFGIIADKVVKYLLTSSYLVPGLFFFQFRYLYSACRRYKIGRVFEKKKQGEPIESRYLYLTQGMLNVYYERPDMGLDSKYTQVYSLIFLNGFAGLDSPLLTTPLMSFLMVVTAAIDLKLIYSRYKRPCHEFKNLSDNMMTRLILLSKMLTLVLLLVNISSKFTLGPVQGVLLFVLLCLVLVNFDLVLKVFENYVKNRCLEKPFKRCKTYEENADRSVVDYESEYKGLSNIGEGSSVGGTLTEDFEGDKDF